MLDIYTKTGLYRLYEHNILYNHIIHDVFYIYNIHLLYYCIMTLVQNKNVTVKSIATRDQ